MDDAIISMRSVSKSYGAFTLGPVNVEIEPGYVVAVVGPNGSGKTTLFRMLMNLVAPDSGEIEVFGQQHAEHEVAIKQRVGYMPETAVGYEKTTVRELGDFVAFWYPTWNGQAFHRALREADIQLEQSFGTLSKGLQRRVTFALARATEADLLLLDEPTASVDPFARREMTAELSRYMQSGDRTVLMATHIMEEVRRLADYIMLIHNGTFYGFHEKDTLLEQWRSIWVDREPQDEVPGVIQIEPGTPVRLITNDPVQTEQSLAWEGVQVVRNGPIDLEEILSFLIHEHTRV